MDFWCTTLRVPSLLQFHVSNIVLGTAASLFFQPHHWHAWSQSSRAVALFSLDVFHCVASLPSVSSLASPIFTLLFYSLVLILLASFHSLCFPCIQASLSFQPQLLILVHPMWHIVECNVHACMASNCMPLAWLYIQTCDDWDGLQPDTIKVIVARILFWLCPLIWVGPAGLSRSYPGIKFHPKLTKRWILATGPGAMSCMEQQFAF